MRRLQPRIDETLRTALASALHRSGELRFMHRLHAVLLVSFGRSCYEVALWFGENPRSIERWVHAYGRSGCEGLHDHHHGGRPPRLTRPQSQLLARELAGGPGHCGYTQSHWCGKLLARHLERDYGVRLSLRHCQRLLQAANAARNLS